MHYTTLTVAASVSHVWVLWDLRSKETESGVIRLFLFYSTFRDVGVLVIENIMGFILNTPTDYRFGFVRLPFHRKHWIAIRKVGNYFLNLDSKLDSPETIGDTHELVTFLRRELRDGDKELLLVVDPGVSEAASWRRDSLTPTQHSNHIVKDNGEVLHNV